MPPRRKTYKSKQRTVKRPRSALEANKNNFKFGHPYIHYGTTLNPFPLKLTQSGVTSEPKSVTIANQQFLLPYPKPMK